MANCKYITFLDFKKSNMTASFLLYKMKELILVTGLTKMVIGKFTGVAPIMGCTFAAATTKMMAVWMKIPMGK